MNLREFTNLNTISLIENSTELIKLNNYQSKEYVESFLGLGIHRSFFYGRRIDDQNIYPLKKTETSFNSADDIELLIEGVVILNDIPENIGTGSLSYSGYGILDVNGVIIYSGTSTISSSSVNSITDDLTINAAYISQNSRDLHIEVNKATAVTVTLEADVPVGTTISFAQDGVGQVIFAEGSGVTITPNLTTADRTTAQESVAAVIKVSSTEYRLVGDITTP